jgi:glycosyltransferase involved in cell wall biosynthesis
MKRDSEIWLQTNVARHSPLLSIITVVFRARRDLPDLIDSVLRVKDETTEFIVIDGGSDDGTRELLCQYGSAIDYWVSEPDKGIYDAMNKGIAAAQGTFIFHLNAGDRIMHIPRPELEAAALQGLDAVAFRVSVDGNEEFRPSYGFSLRLQNTLHHQGTFFRRASVPPYDTRYRVFADFDVNQRLALRGARIEIFSQVVALHATGGISDVASRATNSEFFQIIAKNFGRSHLPLAWLLCKWRGLLRRLARIRCHR